MKSLGKVFAGLCCVVIVSSTAFGQVTSNGSGGGTWANGAIWVGGIAPVAGDNVVIVSGDVVTLGAAASCTNCTVNTGGTLDAATFALTVSATFTLQSGATFRQGGTVTAAPGVTRSFDNASTFIFYGTQTSITGNFSFGNLTWSTTSNGTPSGNLQVNGDLTLTTNNALRGSTGTTSSRNHTVVGNVFINGTGTGCQLVGSNGTTNGTWNIGGNVTVSGSCRLIGNTSAGTTGIGTFNIDGNLIVNSSTATIEFGSNATSSGQGIINLKGNLQNDGKIWQNQGTGSLNINFVGSSAQSVTSPGATGLITPFTTATLNMTVNNTAGVTFGMNVPVNGAFTLTSGEITLGSSNLTVGSVTGGSSASYIVTNGTGSLIQNVPTTNTNVVFPVGTATTYNPVILNNNGGTADNYSVLVASSTSNVVDPTNVVGDQWTINEAVDGGSNITATFQWNSGEEGGSFGPSRSSAVVGQYLGSATNWNILAGTIEAGSDPYTAQTPVLTGTGIFVNSVYGIGTAAALPVEMSSFVATASHLSALLRWSTATETNNFGFEIERKSTNASWSKIGFVAGAGTSTSLHTYTFSDNLEQAGLYEYRIKQIDKSGASKYSPSTQVEVGLAAKVLSLGANYPNPFNPSTNLEFTVPSDGRVVLKVYNIVGQEVATLFDGNAVAGQLTKATFNASRLPSGVYFSRMEFGGNVLVKRMMLLK